MEGHRYSCSNQVRDINEVSSVFKENDDGDALHSDRPQVGSFNETEQPNRKEARRPTQLKFGKNQIRSNHTQKARTFYRIFGYSFVLVLTALVTILASIETSLHNKSSSESTSYQELIRPSLIRPNTINVTQPFRAADSSPQYLTVKNVTVLGAQHSTSVTNVSRDGGSSVLLNGKIVWLYDDTASRNRFGSILSFLSNTAAYSSDPNGSVTLVRDFGVVLTNQSNPFELETGILASEMVNNGAWIPFTKEEAEINKKDPMQERVAIWPGTAPTPINKTSAILFAPLVNVYGQAQNFSNEYQANGITLLSITAPESGPVAHREVDQIIPSGQVPFGGFATLIGNSHNPKDLPQDSPNSMPPKVLYMFGITENGLQLARVLLQDVADFAKWTFFDPQRKLFANTAPALKEENPRKIYLNGSFSSGNIFYNPYFGTFIMVYFKNTGDSTFYYRYLNLAKNIYDGKPFGSSIQGTFVECLSEFQWSAEWMLYKSPAGPGGYNYAGTVHSEFFNRGYYGGLGLSGGNPWYGQNVVAAPTPDEPDGKHIMLSWTSQLHGGANTGVYRIMMAAVEFNNLTDPSGFYGPQHESNGVTPTTTTSTATSSPTLLLIPTSPLLPKLFANGAHHLCDGYSFWTAVCKLALVGVTAKLLAKIT